MRKASLVYILAIPFGMLCIMFLEWTTVNAERAFAVEEIEALAQGIESESPTIRNHSIEFLLDALSRKEVSTIVNEKLKRIIEKQFNNNVNRNTILLAGLSEVEHTSHEIQNLASTPIVEPEVGHFRGTNEWAATLILARRGHKSSINKLLDFAKKQDLHTQVVFVLKDFRYVPQPEIVSYLKEFLESDERLEPLIPGEPGPPIANYAAASLAKLLDGFPIKFKEDYTYKYEEILVCREWMARQQDWQFK